MRMSDWSSDVCSSDRRIDHHGRNLGLSKHLESLKPTFSANKIVTRPIGIIAPTDLYWPFQANRFDIAGNFPVLALVARPRIENRYPRDRDHFDHLRAEHIHQAASAIRAAIGRASCREREWQYV